MQGCSYAKMANIANVRIYTVNMASKNEQNVPVNEIVFASSFNMYVC